MERKHCTSNTDLATVVKGNGRIRREEDTRKKKEMTNAHLCGIHYYSQRPLMKKKTEEAREEAQYHVTKRNRELPYKPYPGNDKSTEVQISFCVIVSTVLNYEQSAQSH